MGLFRKKQQPIKPSHDDAVQAADEIFNDPYRKELRRVGVEHFRKLLDRSVPDIKHDTDAIMKQVTLELKQHMTKQIDATITNINAEITNQLNQRITEFNRLASEAQNQAAQSLSQNTQEVYEKYQAFSNTLQQTISSQEVMMVSVFQDNKSKAAAVQNEQDKALRDISEVVANVRQQTAQLFENTQRTISEQADQFAQANQQSIDMVNQTRSSQDKALASLSSSADALAAQHQQLRELLDKSVADQKAMMVDVINDNMSRIVEHYLIGALGEQSDLAAQLPAILQQMEQSKQAMVDDMKL